MPRLPSMSSWVFSFLALAIVPPPGPRTNGHENKKEPKLNRICRKLAINFNFESDSPALIEVNQSKATAQWKPRVPQPLFGHNALRVMLSIVPVQGNALHLHFRVQPAGPIPQKTYSIFRWKRDRCWQKLSSRAAAKSRRQKQGLFTYPWKGFFLGQL